MRPLTAARYITGIITEKGIVRPARPLVEIRARRQPRLLGDLGMGDARVEHPPA